MPNRQLSINTAKILHVFSKSKSKKIKINIFNPH